MFLQCLNMENWTLFSSEWNMNTGCEIAILTAFPKITFQFLFSYKWLYSKSKEVEYIPPQTGHAHTISQLSSDWIMHCGSTLLQERLPFQKEKKKKHLREMQCLSNLSWCLLCHKVDLLFSCTQAQAVYQTGCDDLGLWCQPSKWSVTGCLTALNMHISIFSTCPFVKVYTDLAEYLYFRNMYKNKETQRPFSVSKTHFSLILL